MSEPIEQIAALLGSELGTRTAGDQLRGLAAALTRALPDTAPDAALGKLRARGPALERLIDEVTVQESYFMRDPGQLRGIDWHVLARGSQPIRVWSAACAAGEEPYSLALLACEALGPNPPVEILATDVSQAALAKARRGVYRPRAVRELDPALRDRYLAATPEGWRVGETLRPLVTFEAHNLVRDPTPPAGRDAFDLVLCRNVLIYLEGEVVDRVLASLERARRADGVLALGAADVLCATARRLGAPAPEPVSPRVARTARAPVLAVPGELALIAESAGAAEPAELLARCRSLLEDDPLNATAHFLCGVAQLEAGDADAAAAALRRALYAEAGFGLAAYTLGRAHEARGDLPAARRAYEQAIRTLGAPDARHRALLGQVEAADVEAAARSRLAIVRSTAVHAPA